MGPEMALQGGLKPGSGPLQPASGVVQCHFSTCKRPLKDTEPALQSISACLPSGASSAKVGCGLGHHYTEVNLKCSGLASGS